MNCQWNALTVNVIKTRKIECAKLQLPATLAKSPIKSTASPKLAPSNTEKFNSSDEKSNEALSENHSSIIDSIIPLSSTEDSLNSPADTEDEVFQESFETPPENDGIFSENGTKRCLSLPSYLTLEEKPHYTNESGARFRPRRLFEEALNLESYSRSSRRTRVDSRGFSQDFTDHTFPRLQGHNLEGNASGTQLHAERMKKSKSSLQINCDNNNNVRYDQNNLQSTYTDIVTQSKDRFNVRDWEQKVLVLTSDCEFGTESSNRPRDEIDGRSRSVALTENISTFASDQISKDQNIQRQVKSETHSEMPKLQTVVWDYIKRRSTKKKRKNDSNRLDQNDNLKGEDLKATNQESSSVTDGQKSEDKSLRKLDSVEADTLRPDRNNAGTTAGISRKSRIIRSWKSDPNLNINRQGGKITLRRYNSHNILSPGSDKFPHKLPAMKFEINSDTLSFLLTTAPEEKSIDERMMTLKMSREWLLKELKSIREQDRKLAKQFIHLRTAIVEMKEYCERLDSEGESEYEVGTQETLHKNRKRNESSKERKIPIHNTPAINILSYC